MVEQGLWEWHKTSQHNNTLLRKENRHADCLSHQPVMPASPDDDANTEVQIAKISSKAKNSGEENTIITFCYKMNLKLWRKLHSSDTFSTEQMMAQDVKPIILYLKDRTLPEDTKLAKKISTEAAMYAI